MRFLELYLILPWKSYTDIPNYILLYFPLSIGTSLKMLYAHLIFIQYIFIFLITWHPVWNIMSFKNLTSSAFHISFQTYDNLHNVDLYNHPSALESHFYWKLKYTKNMALVVATVSETDINDKTLKVFDAIHTRVKTGNFTWGCEF